MPQFFLFHGKQFQRTEPRRIHKIRILLYPDQLAVARGMSAPGNFLTDSPRLHLHIRLQQIGQRRFSHTAGSGRRRCPAPQQASQFLHSPPRLCACEKQAVTAGPIHPAQLLLLCRRQQIRFVKTDQTGQSLLLHHNEKTVQQVKIRFRLLYGKNNKRLVDIGHCRPDQCVSAGKDRLHVPFLCPFIQNR